MKDAALSLETTLADGFSEEARYYAEALRLAEEIPVHLKQGASTQEQLSRIMALFQQISAVETRLAPIKELWQQSGQVAGSRLQRAREEVVRLLEQLVAAIHQGEQEAIAQRDQLIPQLDAGIRARRMQHAYRQGS